VPITPVVAIFSKNPADIQDIKLRSSDHIGWESHDFECYFFSDSDDLNNIISKYNPSVFITTGENIADYAQLLNAPYDVRRKWIHVNEYTESRDIGDAAYTCFIDSCLNKEKNLADPLVSCFTPTYRTGNRIYRVYSSLISQRHKNWEWVLYDDSNDGDKTYDMLRELAQQDHRIKVFKGVKPSGMIGEVKRNAAGLCTGKYLVELDHDDVLTFWALDHVVSGFKEYPEGKFLYTDASEVFETGGCVTYGPGWGFGYGKHYDAHYNGAIYTCETAPINPKTIRHIVAAPNHIRAWESEFYFSIGGHNPKLHIADDYELVVRSFLNTRMIQVPRLCYLQYMNSGGNNTQEPRRPEIQRAVRYISSYYDKMIHDRFVELGFDDFVWDEELQRSNMSVPNPEDTPNAALVTKFQDA
jgi:glycosyltransferase involved in cell wall biosynthesis